MRMWRNGKELANKPGAPKPCSVAEYKKNMLS